MAFPVIGGTQESGYNIDNSLRFNDGDSARLENTFGSAGDRTTWTWSGWVKRGNLSNSASRILFAVHVGGSYLNMLELNVNGNGSHNFRYYDDIGATDKGFITTQTFRDIASWYHITFVYDSGNATSTDRLQLYVNGERVTSFSTVLSYPTLNEQSRINSNVTHRIGSLASTGYYDGYMAEINFIDGQALAPTDFGETNDNGVWIPKNYTGSYGTNGFKLEFKQLGTAADATSIGADTSGNDNHFSQTNVTPAVDRTTDTPTNNFCTLNSLANSSYTTLSEGNLKTTGNTSSNNGNTEATMAVANGKWYWEHKMTTSASPYYPTTGVLKPETVGRLLNGGTNAMVGVVTDSVSYEFNGGRRISNTRTDNYFDALLNGDILGIALDMDNGAIYFSRNGTWQNSSDPESGGSKTNAAHTWTADGRYYMAATASYNSSVAEINFGNPTFSISSGNADANGYGNFEYAVPSGYYALCTKNLAEYG